MKWNAYPDLKGLVGSRLFKVDAGQSLGVKGAVFSTVLDPGLSFDTDDVGSVVLRQWKPGEGQELPGHSICRQLLWEGALEAYHILALALAVIDTVRIVAEVLLGVVRQPPGAGCLIGNSSCTLKGEKQAGFQSRWGLNMTSLKALLPICKVGDNILVTKVSRERVG